MKKEKTRSKLIKELDSLVANIVKKRDKYTCQRCHKVYEKGSRALHCSHYFSRRYMGTRWDMENLEAICYGCHRILESDKQGWYTDFKTKQLGTDGIDMLRVKAYSITKLSKVDIENLLFIIKKEDGGGKL